MGIAIRDLTKRFDGRSAVDRLSVDIAPGTFFAIVGASGCGKSTLLRLIAGLETADAGQIALGGRTVSAPGLHLAPEDRGVGVVFQSYALWPHLDVAGNVAFPLEAAGRSRRDARVEAARHLQTVGLADYAGRRPAALSGGQRQRVALARCLAQGARTILMDEPLANLDPHLRGAMEEELIAVHRAAGATTVYITHDQREAMAVADTMAVMDAGRFLQVGPPAEVYARPATADVARFIGEGAVVPVEVRGGVATLAGMAVPLDGVGEPEGAREALLRPADLEIAEDGGLPARAASVLYRGGHWEVRAQVEGLADALVLHAPRPVAEGETFCVRATGGWLLPPAAERQTEGSASAA